MLRATTSGLPELTEKVAAFHGRMTGMIATAIRGEGSTDENDASFSEDELRRGFLLMQVWFASLVGWSGGLHDQAAAIDQVRVAATMLLDE